MFVVVVYRLYTIVEACFRSGRQRLGYRQSPLQNESRVCGQVGSVSFMESI